MTKMGGNQKSSEDESSEEEIFKDNEFQVVKPNMYFFELEEQNKVIEMSLGKQSKQLSKVIEPAIKELSEIMI